MLKDFKAFIMRGNVVDMAVGIIIGAAFGAIVTSLVKDVIMPPIGLALGKIDFANLLVVLKQGTTPGPYSSLAAAQAAGAVSINYGLFINTIITFLIIALVVFWPDPLKRYQFVVGLRLGEGQVDHAEEGPTLEDIMEGKNGTPGVTYRRSSPKVGRNDLCPCGSGKKFKKCHGK